MLKFIKAVYVYGMYIITSPLVLAFSIAVIVWAVVTNKREFGEFDVKESIKVYLEGMYIGYLANKCFINGCTLDEYCEELGKELN